MKTLTFALAALLLTTGAAVATPTLKGDITVTSDIVTIGEMFDGAGALADTAIFRAPAPGTTGVVPLAVITNAAHLAGLADFDAGGHASIQVIRASTVIDAPALAALISSNLAASGTLATGIAADVRFDVADVSFNAAATDTPASLVTLRYLPTGTAFAARFSVAGIDQPVDLTGTITLMTTAPRLVANTPAGTILGAADFETVSVPLATAEAGGFADLDQLVGKQLLRQSHAGVMLKPTDVGEPQVVARNTLVTVLLKAGAMTLTVKGQALTSAAAGQPVDVLNTVSKKILHGVAEPDGTVEIDTAITVAGL